MTRALCKTWCGRSDCMEQGCQREPSVAPSSKAAPTFEQVRDAIVSRMGGHTISERDAPAWRNFMGLLKLVKASECAMPSATALPILEEAMRRCRMIRDTLMEDDSNAQGYRDGAQACMNEIGAMAATDGRATNG